MKNFKNGGLLSEAYSKADLDRWCSCHVCKIVFKDDVPGHNQLSCPNGCGGALYRGLSSLQIMQLQGKELVVLQ
jgi:hypothetical protein